MGVVSFLRRLTDSESTAEHFEPNLPADLLRSYRALPPGERRRLAREAEESASASLSTDPSRDYVQERDAHLRLELDGTFRGVEAAIQANFENPGDWRQQWHVVVGQDVPPDGLWGWMIMEAALGLPIHRAQATFATKREARQAGEAAAADFWGKFNRQLAGG